MESEDLTVEEQELIEFLGDSKPEVRKLSIQHVVTWTTKKEMTPKLRNSKLCHYLVKLSGDSTLGINTLVLTAMVNLSQELWFCEAFVKAKMCSKCVRAILDKEEPRRLLYVLLLCNLTRLESACLDLLQSGTRLQGLLLRKLAAFLVDKKASQEAEKEELRGWIAHVLANIAQVELGRELLLVKKGIVLKPCLAPLLDAECSSSLRRGLTALVRNVLVASEHLNWLLGEDDDVDIDVLPHLLYPLIGAGKLSVEDRVGLPFILQPLVDRDGPLPEKSIRLDALHGLLLLTRDEIGVRALRERGVYPILRNLDLVEEDDEIKEVIVDIVTVIHELY